MLQELYWSYDGYKSGDLEKMTAKTDVWGVGHVMWNLVMNVPGKGGKLQMLFLDGGKPSSRKLNNGVVYTNATLKDLFSGAAPYEASNHYNNCSRIRSEAV
jgi:hypothetical protein